MSEAIQERPSSLLFDKKLELGIPHEGPRQIRGCVSVVSTTVYSMERAIGYGCRWGRAPQSVLIYHRAASYMRCSQRCEYMATLGSTDACTWNGCGCGCGGWNGGSHHACHHACHHALHGALRRRRRTRLHPRTHLRLRTHPHPRVSFSWRTG